MPVTPEDRRTVGTASVGITDIGTLPPVGDVPATMHAQVIRADRYGDPATAFAPEVVETPKIGPGEALRVK